MDVLVADLILVGIVAFYMANRKTVNRRLKAIKRTMPGADSKPWSSVTHGIIVLVAAAGGYLLAGPVGGVHWAWLATAAYGLREVRNARGHLRRGTPDRWSWSEGWATDGIRDFLLPLAAALAVTWLWVS